eukprot:298967-Alexandrium_andersonii.AAC.1
MDEPHRDLRHLDTVVFSKQWQMNPVRLGHGWELCAHQRVESPLRIAAAPPKAGGERIIGRPRD